MISCNLNPYAIDINHGELVREVKNKPEIIRCTDEKAARIMCFDQHDLNIINKCMRRCKEK